MSYESKPGTIQAIGIMHLIGGILAILVGIGIALGSVFLYLPWIYSLVVGILAIVRGAKLLGDGAYGAGNSKAVAIMQIINIICCDWINLTLGIVCLVLAGNQDVDEYLSGR